MSIKECYDKMGADFDEVMQRLGSESFIKRFAVKFLDDSSYQMILDGKCGIFNPRLLQCFIKKKNELEAMAEQFKD